MKKWFDLDTPTQSLQIIVPIALLVGLYTTTGVNYLLFHSLVEIFSIVVACCVFVIAWHSRNYIRNPYLLFIGMAYLFIGFLDLLHTLSYKGMPIFTDYDYYANQLWIAARYMESITLLVAFLYLHKGKLERPSALLWTYLVTTAFLVGSIFYWNIFPVCFIDGQGLTPFKKKSEYLICWILLVSVMLLVKNRHRFDPMVFSLILGSILCTMVSELAFTFYISNYGFSNLVGHYFKLFSFYLVYQALIITGVREPFKLIFYELDDANRRLRKEVATRRKTEQQREKLIGELKEALAEINTLKGILPLCSFCKKIRDDDGSWQEVEYYIHKHAGADFSHGICPECVRRHYPELAPSLDDSE